MKQLFAAVVILLTVLVPAVAAQQENQFRKRYGPPDSHNRYIVRPGIGMTIEVAQNGRISRIAIKRLDADETSRTGPILISAETTKEILEEIVPDARRGKLQQRSQFAASCFGLQIDEYKDLIVSQATRCAAQGGGIYYAAVQFR